MKLRIATRRSPLALWQAEHVAARLRAAGADVELVPMLTTGDRLLDASLAQAGGKGLFLKELERALEDGRADLAVHSMKDVPVTLAPHFVIAAMLERADPHDAFVSTRYARLDDLPQGARVGTSSLRRRCQLKAHRADLDVVPVRGNVQTRLSRLEDGTCDAVVLAVAGLERLGLGARVRERLSPDVSLPAIGQGAIGVECLAGNAELRARLARVDDGPTRTCVTAERALNEGLGGSCVAPVAGYARIDGPLLRLRGLVGDPDGRRVLRGERSGPVADAARIGLDLAGDLNARGAAALLASAASTP
jgi:hydroxymethylbilane synthase